jgi:DNA-binding transcriptional LysR family regulator
MNDNEFLDISSLEAKFLVELAENQTSADIASFFNWSPSKVAHKLVKIEEKIGKKLFIRNRRAGKYIPTKDINNVIPFLKNIIQSSELLQSEINTKDGHVKVTTSQSLLEFYLGPYVKEFLETNPELKLYFNQKDDLIIPNPLFNEIIITLESECKLPSLKYFPYHSFKQKLWASPSYIDRYGPPKSINDLHRFRLLMRKNTDDPRFIFGSKYIESHLIASQHPDIFEINGVRLVDYLCEQGCGIMAGSEESIKLGRLNLENVLPDFEGDSLDIYIGVNKEFLKSPKAKTVINWIFESRNRAFRAAGIKPSFDFTTLK